MPGALAKDTISLNGFDMTLDQAWSIAEGKAKVGLTDVARKRVEKAFDTLMMFASADKPVYGVTLGVGENKDQNIFDTDGTMTPEAREASKAFQINVLRSHSAGVGEPMASAIVATSPIQELRHSDSDRFRHPFECAACRRKHFLYDRQ